MERLVDPVIADIQTEHDTALRSGRRWRAIAIHVSGCFIFWKAIAWHSLRAGPQSLWSDIAAEKTFLRPVIAVFLVTFVAVALVLAALSMRGIFLRTQSGVALTLLALPQAIPISVPIAVGFGIACGVADRGFIAARARTVMALAIVAGFLAFIAILTLPAANQAFRVLIARQIQHPTPEVSITRGPNELSLSELARHSRRFHIGESAPVVRTYLWIYHTRLALPAAAIAVSILEIGLWSRLKGRGRRALATLLALGVYWAVLGLGAQNASLPPALTAWAPNAVLSAVGVALLMTRSAGECVGA
jgi:lipopolysaccharide export LptBFGC system permease protein LptF